MLTNPYTRRQAYEQAAQDVSDIDEELERERARRLADDEQAARDAEEASRPRLPPRPAPVVSPQPQRDEGINWGKAIGEALGNVVVAAVNKRVQKTEPVAPVVAPPPLSQPDLTPPPPSDPAPPSFGSAPAGLRPEDAEEVRRRFALVPSGAATPGSPAPAGLPPGEDDGERRRRLALVPGGAAPPPPAPVVAGHVFTPPAPDSAPVDERLLQLYGSRLVPEGFEPSRVPMAGRVKAGPAPGEEEADDARFRFRERLKPYGGFEEGGDVHTRERVASPREYLERRIAETEANPTRQNSNSRTLLRPSMNDTGDSLADVEEYRRQLDAYTNPKAKDRWYVAAAKRLIPGAVEGYNVTHTLAGALGGMGVAGTHAALNPNVGERDWRDQEKVRAAGLEQQEAARRSAILDYASKLADLGYKQSQTRETSAKAANEEGQPALNLSKMQAQKDEAERDNLRQTWNGLQEFDPASTDPTIQSMVGRARELNMFLPKKTRDTADWELTPVGNRTVLHNRRTNEIKEATLGGQPLNPVKEKELTANDLPNTLFGLPDDKQIADEARASVEPTTRDRRIKPEILSGYYTTTEPGPDGNKVPVKHPFANPDGTPNMDEIWRGIDLETVKPSDVWENVTEKDDQRLAAARKAVSDRYASDRGLVDDFRLRVTRNHPNASAVSTPVANIVDRFNQIRKMHAGTERTRALKTFYDTLPYLRIE